MLWARGRWTPQCGRAGREARDWAVCVLGCGQRNELGQQVPVSRGGTQPPDRWQVIGLVLLSKDHSLKHVGVCAIRRSDAGGGLVRTELR